MIYKINKRGQELLSMDFWYFYNIMKNKWLIHGKKRRSRDLLQWQGHEAVEYILYEYLWKGEIEDYGIVQNKENEMVT